MQFWDRIAEDDHGRASEGGSICGVAEPDYNPGIVFSLCKAAYEARGNKIEKLTDFTKTRRPSNASGTTQSLCESECKRGV
jgi:hypothetical protein